MQTKHFLTFLFTLLLLYSCSDRADISVLPEESSFFLVDLNGKNYVPFFTTNDDIFIYVPQEVDLTQMSFSSSSTEDIVCIKGKEYKCESRFDLSSFQDSVLFYGHSLKGVEKRQVVVLDLPVLVINTPDLVEIESKEERVEGCTIQVITEDVKEIGTAGIRGRGSSSWLQEKKPYNIKLDESQGLLGMPASKNWILLANAYYDRTQLHNDVAFEIARITDFPWVQSGEFVELIINGVHKGLYYLCEKIGVEEHKINVEPSKNSDTTGFLIESFVVLEENDKTESYPERYFRTNHISKTGDNRYPCILGWEVKYPKKDNKDAEVASFVDIVEDNIINQSNYNENFDIESAINWLLVEELTLNEEASRSKNMYMYKTNASDAKLTIGPPWDFDAWTFGIYDRCAFYAKDSGYYKYLLQDPYFIIRLKEKWSIYKQLWMTLIPDYINKQYLHIRKSALRNENKWKDWHPLWRYGEKSYDEIVEDMQEAFMAQLEWMDIQIQQM